MGNKNEFLKMKITNYRKAWIDFRKSQEYRSLSNSLKENYGMKQRYASSFLSYAFAAGWRASGVKIVFVKF